MWSGTMSITAAKSSADAAVRCCMAVLVVVQHRLAPAGWWWWWWCLLPVLTLRLAEQPAAAQQLPGPEHTLLPFVTTDAVVQRQRVTGQVQRLTGVIENVTGEVVQLRRSSDRLDAIALRDVVELQFQKSPEFDAGLLKLQRQDYAGAVAALRAALQVEPRGWVTAEIRAATARALLGLRQYEDVIREIDSILQQDAQTRHVALLPLVWDERLPASERYAANPADLQATSVTRQLTAAAALLQQPAHEGAAVEVLTRLRTAASPGVQHLAEVQLWRQRLLHPERLRRADVTFWQDRVRDWHGEVRGCGEFVLGRALLQLHDYDGAALSLLWLPGLTPHDPATAASSLRDAAVALQASGRTAAAQQLTEELRQRFPHTSVAAAEALGGQKAGE